MSFRKLLAATAGVVFLTGCATSRSVVTTDVAAVENPTSGVAVRIEEVEDVRRFAVNPHTPDIPSLSDDRISDASLTSRAIGRKRGGFGKALGDVLLDDKDSVSAATTKALVAAFRKAGYRVLGPNDPGYAQAIPVQARINQFWEWIDMGFWQLTLHCRAEVVLQGGIEPLAQARTARADVAEGMTAVFESDWQAGAGKCLTALSDDVVRTVKAAK